MVENQYSLFRDLDRRCLSGGLNENDCRETVRRKRSIIESDLNQRNPVAREVLDERTTFVAIYNSYSRSYRGLRRFVPHSHDVSHNERLEHFEKIVPNVRHFRRRSIFAADNPLICAFYGLLASNAIVLLWANSVREDSESAVVSADDEMHIWLRMAGAVIGAIVGIFAMINYRTRDRNHIHAREAAAYMDLNYECCRAFDDEAWARFMVLKSENKIDPSARPTTIAAATLKSGGPATSPS